MFGFVNRGVRIQVQCKLHLSFLIGVYHRRLQGLAFRGIARLKFPETESESLIILQ